MPLNHRSDADMHVVYLGLLNAKADTYNACIGYTGPDKSSTMACEESIEKF